MTVWDYLDRHEIIGTGLVCFCVFWLALATVDIVGHISRAWAARRQGTETKE